MFVSLKANKKRIAAFAILALAVVGVWFFLRKDAAPQQVQPVEAAGETEQERVEFLQGFGWQVESPPAETREVMIPAQFNDVYENYNAMQQAQGFDLRPHAGETCTQYKYHITNYPGETEVFATLLVRGRLIIGGDVACAKAAGFMHGFAKDSARYGEATPRPAQSAEPASSGMESSPAESGGGVSSEGSGLGAETVENSVESVGNSEQENPEQAESPAENTGAVPEDGYPTD